MEIERLGVQGDGVAQGPKGPLFVPFALPGERVRVALDPGNQYAQLLAVLEASPDRIAPICPHFGICGGCALQHLEEGAYLAWKRDQVRAALQSRGLEAEADPVRSVPLASRRRASFALAHTRAGVVLGYHKRGSPEVIGVEVCPVLAPEIVTSLPSSDRSSQASRRRRAKPASAPPRPRQGWTSQWKARSRGFQRSGLARLRRRRLPRARRGSRSMAR